MKGGGYEFVTAYKEPNTKLIQNKRNYYAETS